MTSEKTAAATHEARYDAHRYAKEGDIPPSGSPRDGTAAAPRAVIDALDTPVAP